MTGTFCDIDGVEYTVQIGTSAGTLTLGANPVTLTMAKAAHKFAGLKTMSATFRFITDAPLTSLYAATPTGILATLRMSSSSSYIFYGYVVPFAFDQPYDGCGDEVEVEAVDCLSAVKDISQSAYLNRSAQEFEALSQSALDILKGACEYAGITEIVEHLNFDEEALDSFEMSGKAFLDDYGNNGETIGNIVSWVAQFFGYTAVVDGRRLVLWDESALSTTRDAKVFTYFNGSWNAGTTRVDWFDEIQVGGNDIRQMGGKVSVERAYDGVTMQVTDTNGAAIIPDLLDNASLDGQYAADTIMHWYNQNAGYGGAYRMAMASRIIETGRSTANGLVAFSEQDSYMEPNMGEPGDDWKLGSVLMKYWFLDKDEDGNTKPAAESNLLWVRVHRNNDTTTTDEVSLFETKQGEARAHIKGPFRITIKGRWNVYSEYGRDGWEVPEGSSSDATTQLKWLFVRCGNLYLNKASNANGYVWSSSRVESPLMMGAKDWQSGYASAQLDSGWIVAPPSTDGLISIEGYLPSGYIAEGYDYFIEALKIETRGDAIDTDVLTTEFITNGIDNLQASVGIVGEKADDGSRLFVEGHLPYHQNGCRRRFVGNSGWQGAHVVLGTSHPGVAGWVYPLLCRRYANKHIAYQVTVADYISYTAVMPWCLIDLAWADGPGKTVEAMTWDVADAQKTILID